MLFRTAYTYLFICLFYEGDYFLAFFWVFTLNYLRGLPSGKRYLAYAGNMQPFSHHCQYRSRQLSKVRINIPCTFGSIFGLVIVFITIRVSFRDLAPDQQIPVEALP